VVLKRSLGFRFAFRSAKERSLEIENIKFEYFR